MDLFSAVARKLIPRLAARQPAAHGTNLHDEMEVDGQEEELREPDIHASENEEKLVVKGKAVANVIASDNELEEGELEEDETNEEELEAQQEEAEVSNKSKGKGVADFVEEEYVPDGEPGTSRKHFPCPQCDKIYTKEAKMAGHIGRRHPASSQPSQGAKITKTKRKSKKSQTEKKAALKAMLEQAESQLEETRGRLEDTTGRLQVANSRLVETAEMLGDAEGKLEKAETKNRKMLRLLKEHGIKDTRVKEWKIKKT